MKSKCPSCGQVGHSAVTCIKPSWLSEAALKPLADDVIGVLHYGGRIEDKNSLVEKKPINNELRNILKECIDVLHCHHRNTHKSLIERLRKLKGQL